MLLLDGDDVIFVTCDDDPVSFTSLLSKAVTLSSDTQQINHRSHINSLNTPSWPVLA